MLLTQAYSMYSSAWLPMVAGFVCGMRGGALVSNRLLQRPPRSLSAFKIGFKQTLFVVFLKVFIYLTPFSENLKAALKALPGSDFLDFSLHVETYSVCVNGGTGQHGSLL